MTKLRWKRAMLLGAAALTLGAWPVAARTDRSRGPDTPPPYVVRAMYGDSLWTLARRYGDPHRDVRAIVSELSRANGIEPGQLQPGDGVVFPAGCLAPR